MSAPSASSDRNLLFGLLALQMDFIDRDQLVEAMNAWLLEKHTPLGEVLRRRGAIDEDDRADLDKLVAKHLKRHGGEQASLAAVRVEAPLRASLARLDPGLHASLSPATTPPDAPTPGYALLGPPAPGALPMRYRRLRPHAKGGLGEVSVALDEELHREVALKEIQECFADDPGSRARFVREAEVTGALEHPGVVPVYELGYYPDGRPYYAMRFIKGESLQEAIERFHQADQARGERWLALRELLARFVAVCNAVAYAHARGVIHRDLKPGNVMLGPFGETLVVDWGLARLVDRPDPEATTADVPVRLSGTGSSAATEVGQAVGTPAYMSPEQALGQHDRMGPASDVYSLGAILYAILTGKPPYDGTSAAEVLSQAQKADVVPARKRGPGVPRPLDSVCARAMAASPRDRYPDAVALAEEVRRWLADEPVAAHPEPAIDRLQRWGRRNRVAVMAAVVLLLAGVVGLSAGLWAVNREKGRTALERDRAVEAEGEAKKNLEVANANLERAEKAEAEAKANLARADANLKLAREAIDECFNAASKHPVFQQPRMEKARKLLMEKTLLFYKNLRSRRPDDPRLRRDEADQFYRVGEIERVLGNPERARQAYEQARGKYAELARLHPDALEYRMHLAGMHNNLGVVLGSLGRRSEAARQYREARDQLRALVEVKPQWDEARNDLARAHQNVGLELENKGDRPGALEEYRRARDLRVGLVKAHPADRVYRSDLATSHDSLGRVLRGMGKREEAVEEITRALAHLGKLVERHPESAADRNDLARAHLNLALLRAEDDQREESRKEALKEARAAEVIQRDLIKSHPDIPAYRADLASTLNALGVVLKSMGEPEEALEACEQARDLAAEVAKAHPEVSDYARSLGVVRDSVAGLLFALGRREDGLKEYREVLAHREALAKANRDDPQYRGDLATTHFNLGVVLRDMGRTGESAEQFAKARDLWLALAGAHPDTSLYTVHLARACLNRGDLLARNDDPRAAVADLDEGLTRLDRLRRIDPRNPALPGLLRYGLLLRAPARTLLGRPDADADWDRLLSLTEAKQRPAVRAFRAQSRARASDYLRAAADVEQVAFTRPLSGQTLYALARTLALAVNAAAADSSRPLPEREKRAEGYARDAVELLGRAAPYLRDPKGAGRLDTDPALQVLRGRADFRALREKVKGAGS